tara:strand:- start:533 stop:652 length:120 start_codon:yes stop_codon:yes gene_type:complete
MKEEFISDCCGALPEGETHSNMGFCSDCKEHTMFNRYED